MPCGTICQLKYQGGGQLLYKGSGGGSLQICFLKAPYLRVGQLVSFSIRDGLAVDVAPLDATALSNEKAMEMVVPRSSQQERSVRKLYRSIARFRNADVDERDQLITGAEESLQQYLESSEVDGDAICALVLRCSGWLHPPVSPVPKETATAEVAVKVSSEVSNLQWRLRKLLIRALNCLDLTDPTTRRELWAALIYIQTLLRNWDTCSEGLTPSRTATQWKQLEALVGQGEGQRITEFKDLKVRKANKAGSNFLSADVREEPGVPEPEPSKALGKRRAVVHAGTYRPHQKIRELPSVFHADEGVELKCSQCPRVIASNWFWRHPVSGKVRVLVPHKGHTCPTKLGKKRPWLAQGNMPQKNDRLVELNFCVHNRQKHFCKDCGGRYFCPHGMRIYSCLSCKSQGAGRGKTDKTAPERGRIGQEDGYMMNQS
jgi:ribosomal protein L37AE/L43A